MKLKEFLDASGIQYKDFAKNAGITPNTVLNIIHKGDCKLSIALKIEELTMGAVKCRDLSQIQTEGQYRRGQYKRRSSNEPCDKIVDSNQDNSAGNSHEAGAA